MKLAEKPKRSEKKIGVEACHDFIQHRLKIETIINISDLLKEMKRSRECAVRKDMSLQEFIAYLLFSEYSDQETVIFQYNGEVLICWADDFGEMWENIKNQQKDEL